MDKHIKADVLWNTLGTIAYFACQWLLTVIVVKAASYEAAGYLSLAMSTSGSFYSIASFSMRNFQVSDVKSEYSNGIYVGSRFITSLAAFACCLFVAVLTSEKIQAVCTMSFMAVRIVEALADVLHGIDQKHGRYDYIGISYILRGIATISFFYMLLRAAGSLPLALSAAALSNIIAVFAFDWRRTCALDGFAVTLSSREIWSLLKKCIPLVIFSFMLSLENLIPKTMLQSEYGTDILGIYSSIASPTLVVQVSASVAFAPFLPIISEAAHNNQKEEYKRMMHRLYLVFAGMGVAVTAGALLLGRIGLRLLFGSGILQHYRVFMPIVWCTILTGIVWILSSVIIALRRIKILLLGMMADFALCMALSPLLVREMGMNGVSAVQIIALAAYTVFMVAVCETY